MIATSETKNKPEDEYPQIVTTSFPAYDFARAITKGTNLNVHLLLTPGTELHSYEPTPEDLLLLNKSKIVIAIGGESESWFFDSLDYIYPDNTKIFTLTEFVEQSLESSENIIEIDDEPNNEEYDEHVWTSPKNCIKIVKGLAERMTTVYPDKKNTFTENAADYATKISELDKQFEELANSTVQPIVIADRFPFYYFVHDYGFKYYAAFPGCAEESEASASTISKLINLIKENRISTIFTIELSDQKVAKTIAESTGAKIEVLHSAHNISLNDYENGTTIYDLMKYNLEKLQKALK